MNERCVISNLIEVAQQMQKLLETTRSNCTSFVSSGELIKTQVKFSFNKVAVCILLMDVFS